MSKSRFFASEREKNFRYKNLSFSHLSPCGGVHAPRIIRDDNTTTNRALKERESYYREHAGRGDFERERERERERNWKIHFGRDKREESCLRRRRERDISFEKERIRRTLSLWKEREGLERRFFNTPFTLGISRVWYYTWCRRQPQRRISRSERALTRERRKT